MHRRRSPNARNDLQGRRGADKRATRRMRYEAEARRVKALGHPKRLLLLDLLNNGRERTVTDLTRRSGIRQSNVSQNLAVLRAAGVVSSRRQGATVHYRLADPHIWNAVGNLRAALDGLGRQRRLARDAAPHRSPTRAGRSAKALVAVVGLAAAAASLHPVLAGSSWESVPAHVTMMLTSPDPGSLVRTCLSIPAALLRVGGTIPPAVLGGGSWVLP